MKRKNKRGFRVKKLNLRAHQSRLKAIPVASRTASGLWLLFLAGLAALLFLLLLRK